jgi:hypothetical protein
MKLREGTRYLHAHEMDIDVRLVLSVLWHVLREGGHEGVVTLDIAELAMQNRGATIIREYSPDGNTLTLRAVIVDQSRRN